MPLHGKNPAIINKYVYQLSCINYISLPFQQRDNKKKETNSDSLDAQILLDMMQKMKEADQEFYFKFILDNCTNALEGICWAFPFMAKRASKVGLRFLIFDTTHETNRFGCYTCVMCFENELGETEILFMALIMHQV